jgi:predicted ATPase
MLTRLYIDNFRCFVNFEYRPARRQLILGGNGSGKSSLMDAFLSIRQFVARGDRTDDIFLATNRTRWLNQPQQTWEVEASLGGGACVYKLVIEPSGSPPRPRVVSETVHFEGKPLFEFTAGEVHLYNDRFEHTLAYPFDWHRSALATIVPREENQKLVHFVRWLLGAYCFRMNPFSMNASAEAEHSAPNVDLSNLAGWYRHLVQTNPKENHALVEDLRRAMDRFSFLPLVPLSENAKILAAEFEDGQGRTLKFGFRELSEGQRCLVGLYTILHFVVANGGTVIIDEPDNFIALREIQPWLMAVADCVDDGKGQVILISHHPELINQWAPENGVLFVREGVGPVRVKEFRGDPQSGLSPAEPPRLW